EKTRAVPLTARRVCCFLAQLHAIWAERIFGRERACTKKWHGRTGLGDATGVGRLFPIDGCHPRFRNARRFRLSLNTDRPVKEPGTVRQKNQVNALVKILVDFAISTVAYFAIGYTVAYGVGFFQNAAAISGGATGYGPQGYTLVRFFFLCTFAAAVPAIVSGGIAERARFAPQAVATAAVVGLFYPLLEGVYWNGNFGLQEGFFVPMLGAAFHDFAGSVVVHAFGGWLALGAVLCLGARLGRYDERGTATPPSSIPWLAMGSWLLCIGWFGFNVMSAQRLEA